MTLVADLVTRVERRLAQLASPGAQTYAQDTILEHLTSAFTQSFDDLLWPDYNVWIRTELDGVTGVVTADLSQSLNRYLDIIGVYPNSWLNSLPEAPLDIIPSRVTGSQPLYVIAYPERPDKVFRVVPYTATGEIDLHYKRRPVNIDLDTDLRVDDELLVAAATYLYLADDGTNPTATNVALGRLMSRERTVKQQLAKPIPLGGPSTAVDYWWA